MPYSLRLLRILSIPRIFAFISLGLSLYLVPSLNADEHKVGDISIQYSVINTSILTPEVAAQYGITRSKQTAMVNISVLKSDGAVNANIFGNAKNLTGQLTELSFREVVEGEAIYYLATYRINNGEKLRFDLQVQPEKKGVLIPLSFSKALFVD